MRHRPLGVLVVLSGCLLLIGLFTLWWPPDFVPPIPPARPIGIYTSLEYPP